MLMRSLIAVVCLVFSSAPVWATTFIVPDDRELVEKSAAIVEGVVVDGASRTNRNGRIETVYNVRVQRVLKGEIRETVVQVASLGGNVGQRWLAVPGAAHFANGDKVLLFLTQHRGAWTPTDMTLGKFRFITSTGGQSLLVRDEEDIVGFDRQMRTHVERVRREADFVKFVEETVRGRRVEANYFLSPKEAVALKESDKAAFDVSAHAFSAKSYAIHFGTIPGRWAEGPGVFSVPGRMSASISNPYFQSTQGLATGLGDGGVAMLQSSLNGWTNDCGSIVNVPYGGTNNLFANAGSLDVPADPEDGINTVIWNDPQGDITGNWTGAGVVATCFIGGGDRHTFDGRVATLGDPNSGWIALSDTDVVVQNGLTGTESFVDTALMHEIGHGIGLRHSNTHFNGAACDGNDECTGISIMNSTVVEAYGFTPQTYDQNAIRALYPLPCAAANVRNDFNADGRADIIWRDTVAGATHLWFLNGPAIAGGGFLGNLPTALTIPGLGDFNGDGRTDIVWHNGTTGDTFIWLMNGTAIIGGGFVANLPTALRVEGVGDFNGDGRSDLLWRNTSTNNYDIWFMNGHVISGGGFLVNLPASLNMSGIGDFNGDTRSDILWRNINTGDIHMWFMNGATIAGGGQIATLPLSLSVSGVEDFNGDGRADIVWRNGSNGNTDIWFMNGTTISGGGFVASLPAALTVAAVGDYSGDGKADLIWRNTTTGDTHLWQMNGAAIAGGGFLVNLPTPTWKIAPYRLPSN